MLQIAPLSGSIKKWDGDALLILLHEEECKKCELPSPWDDYVKLFVKRKDFDGKKGNCLKVPLLEGHVKNLYLAGLGKSEKYSTALLREVLTESLRRIGRERNQSVLILSDHLGGDEDIALGEAAQLCAYSFDKYKKKDEKDKGEFALKEIYLQKLDKNQLEMGEKLAAAQIFARDLANEPGNCINPLTLSEKAAVFAKENGLTCEIWDEKRLEKEGMGALLAVGSGSKTPPRLVHLVYTPKGKAKKKIALVGKGITFDSGGLDLKPAEFMKTMKGDKSGACNVLGIMKGISELAPKVEVHGFLALAENMPSGTAFRPDDIIRARNGKTIEIDNTDAEGRLILADALCVASELKPDVIIDMATLTGACAVALGNWTAGLFTADDKLCEELLASSQRRGERFWRLPMDDEKIKEKLKSKFADLINSGGRYGGATFAALFLSEFVEPSIAWAHLDIAGVDFYSEEWSLYSKGASAWGVRTCIDYILNQQ